MSSGGGTWTGVSKEYVDGAIADQVAASQHWLPAVETQANLPPIFDTSKTWLCRVRSENNVYQCIAGQTAWLLYSENTDFLPANAQAADSALLNGKADTAFATAAQGTKADAALPATGKAVDSALLNGKADTAFATVASGQDAYNATQLVGLPGERFYALKGTFPSGADLDTYTTIGLWQSGGTATTATLLKLPGGIVSGVLTLEVHQGQHNQTMMVMQRLSWFSGSANAMPRIFTRLRYSTGTWSAWAELLSEANGVKLSGLSAGQFTTLLDACVPNIPQVNGKAVLTMAGSVVNQFADAPAGITSDSCNIEITRSNTIATVKINMANDSMPIYLRRISGLGTTPVWSGVWRSVLTDINGVSRPTTTANTNTATMQWTKIATFSGSYAGAGSARHLRLRVYGMRTTLAYGTNYEIAVAILGASGAATVTGQVTSTQMLTTPTTMEFGYAINADTTIDFYLQSTTNYGQARVELVSETVAGSVVIQPSNPFTTTQPTGFAVFGRSEVATQSWASANTFQRVRIMGTEGWTSVSQAVASTTSRVRWEAAWSVVSAWTDLPVGLSTTNSNLIYIDYDCSLQYPNGGLVTIKVEDFAGNAYRTRTFTRWLTSAGVWVGAWAEGGSNSPVWQTINAASIANGYVKIASITTPTTTNANRQFTIKVRYRNTGNANVHEYEVGGRISTSGTGSYSASLLATNITSGGMSNDLQFGILRNGVSTVNGTGGTYDIYAFSVSANSYVSVIVGAVNTYDYNMANTTLIPDGATGAAWSTAVPIDPAGNWTYTPINRNDVLTDAIALGIPTKSLTTGTDLNTITAYGIYAANSTAVASSLVNAPVGLTQGCRLEVKQTNDAIGNISQILTVLLTSSGVYGIQFIRSCNAGSWTRWRQVDAAPYSTSEVWIGNYWTDGKPIYRRVLSATTGSALDTNTIVTSAIAGFTNLVKLDGYAKNSSGNFIPFQYSAQTGWGVWVDPSGAVGENHADASMTSRPMTIIIEYVK